MYVITLMDLSLHASRIPSMPTGLICGRKASVSSAQSVNICDQKPPWNSRQARNLTFSWPNYPIGQKL